MGLAPNRAPTGQSSDNRPPSRISADEIALTGPSDLPDPAFHAYRRDLADCALAGRIIASHFVVPVDRTLNVAAELKAAADEASETIARLQSGEPFRMMETRMGWSWGYAGEDQQVGYVRSEALGAA
jgi:hypothetical protein